MHLLHMLLLLLLIFHFVVFHCSILSLTHDATQKYIRVTRNPQTLPALLYIATDRTLFFN